MSNLSNQPNTSHRSGATSRYHTANFARASIDEIRRRKKAPSMSDVAELADVSLQTVSRVLNGKTSVSDKTRAKVLAAIDALGYRRNNAAVSLVTNRSHIIGIIDSAAAHSAPYNTIRAIQEAAYNVQYTVCLAHIGSLSQTSIKSTLNALLEQNVDGIIFVSPHHEVLTTIPDVNCPVPIVVVAPANKYLFHSVGVDNAYATSLIIDHLVTLGHQRMAHIAGPLDWVEANARMENWHRTIQSRNLPMIPTYIGDATARSGYELAKRAVTESDATAIVAYNDQTALGAIRGIKELGYRVPQDVSIIGFGDIEDAAFYDPPLTTIRENYREIGTQSMQILIDLMEGHESTDGIITPSLIIRESTATAHDF